LAYSSSSPELAMMEPQCSLIVVSVKPWKSTRSWRLTSRRRATFSARSM